MARESKAMKGKLKENVLPSVRGKPQMVHSGGETGHTAALKSMGKRKTGKKRLVPTLGFVG